MVSLKNEQRVRRKLFHLQSEKSKWKFKIGHQVRISKRRRVFEIGYVAGWSEEIFIVTDRFPTTPVTYAIKDLADEQIKGRFYEPELQLIVYIVMISSIVNLCINDRNTCLWSSLVSGSVGYLLLNASIKRKENDIVSHDNSIQ